MTISQVATIQDARELLTSMPAPDCGAFEAASERNSQLTKPAGSLGRLEEVATWYCGWKGDAKATVEAPQIVIFAGNHGVTAQNISAFPAEVTAQMVLNFEHGGAAINQLSKLAGAELSVVPIDLDKPTADFTQSAAMTEAELCIALNTGWSSVNVNCDLLVVGEMGIGNTTAAAAMLTALYGGSADDWVGPGTGLDDEGIRHKVKVVQRAVDLNHSDDPFEVLRKLGGREIAAMTGAILAARHKKIPVILDGFIASTSAAVLKKCDPSALDHVVAGHVSAESAHVDVLHKLELKPLLDLNMRLGEGSGAAVAIQIVKAALACHSGMATFAEAGVSDG